MTISQIQTFDPTEVDASGVQQGEFSSMISGKCGTIYLINESLVTLLLKNATDEVVGILPATWAQPFVVQAPTPQMKWVAIANQNATNDYTLKEVQGMAYSQGEDTSKLYTGPLIRQASLGNTANTNATVGTLDNSGNSANTNVVNLSSLGASGSTALVSNDGIWKLAVTIANALVTWLQTFEPNTTGQDIVQLGALNYITHILGELQVDQGAVINDQFTTVNGAVGSIEVHQEFRGNYKRLTLFFIGYRPNPATGQQIPFPVPFTKGAHITTGEIGSTGGSNSSVIFRNGGWTGANISLRVTTAIASGGGSEVDQTFISQLSTGELIGAFDTIGVIGDTVHAHDGFVIIEGI